MILNLPRSLSATPSLALLRSERFAGYAVVALAVAFNLLYLLPEAIHVANPVNDNTLHLLNLKETIAAFREGNDPTDFWLAPVGGGYPLFHYYQHLPYIPLALTNLLTGLSAETLLAWSTYLLLSFFPLSVFVSMRRVGFELLESAGACLASFFATNGLFGFDYTSYTWSGYGLYTQLWGMVLLPLALSQSYRVLTRGKGYAWAIGLLAAAALSHLVLGYIGMASLVLMTVVCGSRPELPLRVKRFAVMLVGFAVATAYMFLPTLLDGEYLNRSVWELQSKYDSLGHDFVLDALIKGDLFDFGRFPVLTILVAIGFVTAVRRWREPRYRIGPVVAIFWLLAYFGRPTWGSLMDLLPMSNDLQLHRLIAGVHLGAVFLLGIGFGAVSQWIRGALATRPAIGQAALPLTILLLVVALLPVLSERREFLDRNSAMLEASEQASDAEAADIQGLEDFLRQQPPGRVYAGLATNWGGKYTVGSVPMYGILAADSFDMLGRLYHALSQVGDIQVRFDERNLTHYELFGVRYVVAPAGQAVPTFARFLTFFGRHLVYEIPNEGYFTTGDTTMVFEGSKESFHEAASAWLSSPLPGESLYPEVALQDRSKSNESLPSSPLDAAPRTLGLLSRGVAASRPGSIRETEVERNHYQTSVTADRPLTLVLKASYHPNWKAEVDGRPAETSMVMPGYLGIGVDAGTHTVSLSYERQWYRPWLLLAGILFIGVVGFVERRTGQRTPSTPESSLEVSPIPTPIPNSTPASPLAQAGKPAGLQAVGLAAQRRWRRIAPSTRIAVALYLLLLSVYVATASGHFYSSDHVAVYQATESLVEEGNLSIEPINNAVIGRDGQPYSQYGIGQVLASLPLYLLGDLVADTVGPDSSTNRYFSGDDIGMWGGTTQIYFVSLLNQLLAPLLGVLVFLFVLRLGFSTKAALATSLAYGLATLAWAGAHEYFQHVLEALGLFGAVYIIFSRQSNFTPVSALIAGSVLGFGIVSRFNLVLFVPFVGLYLLWCRWKALGYTDDASTPLDFRRLPRIVKDYVMGFSRREASLVLCFILPLVLAAVIVMSASVIQFGDPRKVQSAAVDYGFTLATLPTGLIGNFFSPGRSVFLYSPPILLGVIYLKRFYQAFPAEGLLIGAISLVYLVFFSTFRAWDSGLSWGPRYLEGPLPFLMLPVAFAFAQRPTTWVFASLVALGVCVQLLGVVVNVSYVNHETVAKGFSPETAYLFVPSISPIPAHLDALLEGRHIDLWLKFVYDHFSATTFLVTALVPIGLFIVAVRLLRQSLQDAMWVSGDEPSRGGLLPDPTDRLS